MYRAATDRQRAALEALIATGSYKAAAAYLGVSERTIHDRLQRLRSSTGLMTYQLVYWHRRTIWGAQV